jgi:hypothetical protein
VEDRPSRQIRSAPGRNCCALQTNYALCNTDSEQTEPNSRKNPAKPIDSCEGPYLYCSINQDADPVRLHRTSPSRLTKTQ